MNSTLSLRKESIQRASSTSEQQRLTPTGPQSLLTPRPGRDQVGPTLTTSFTTIG